MPRSVPPTSANSARKPAPKTTAPTRYQKASAAQMRLHRHVALQRQRRPDRRRARRRGAAGLADERIVMVRPTAGIAAPHVRPSSDVVIRRGARRLPVEYFRRGCRAARCTRCRCRCGARARRAGRPRRSARRRRAKPIRACSPPSPRRAPASTSRSTPSRRTAGARQFLDALVDAAARGVERARHHRRLGLAARRTQRQGAPQRRRLRRAASTTACCRCFLGRLAPQPPQDPARRRRGRLPRRHQHRRRVRRTTSARRAGPTWRCEIRGPAAARLGQRSASEPLAPTTSARAHLPVGTRAEAASCAGATSRRSPARAQRILVAHGYFLPDRGIIRAHHRAAAQRGVAVQLLLAGRSDVPFARAAT